MVQSVIHIDKYAQVKGHNIGAAMKRKHFSHAHSLPENGRLAITLSQITEVGIFLAGTNNQCLIPGKH